MDADANIKFAEWDRAFINDLPDSSFAIILPGGEKDEDGKTRPRALRKLPFKDQNGKIDLPHLRNALARLPQTDLNSSQKAKARSVLIKAARAAGIGEYSEIVSYLDEYHLATTRYEEDPVYGTISRLKLFKVGSHEHPVYGPMVFTSNKLRGFKENFDNRVRKIDIAMDFEHQKGEAPGWIKELYFNEDETELWSIVQWTPVGLKAVEDKLYQYHSPEFGPYTDSESGRQYEDVLYGVALTNRPFLKDQPKIQLSETFTKTAIQEDLKMTPEEIKEKEDAIAEREKKLDARETELKTREDALASKDSGGATETKAQLSEKETEIVKLSESNKQLSEEVKALRSEIETKKKEDAFKVLLEEGKVVPAQKDAFLAGDLGKFIENQPKGKLNFDEKGSSEDNNKDVVELDEHQKQMNKKFGVSDEDFLKHNKGGK